jgi:glycosyltransferase involved in cell wall biosynthesis
LRTLPRAVASVLAQDEPDFELILVDDASTDGTQRWLATLADPRIRLITCDTNRGPSAARNRGLAVARAPLAAFLDSDDVFRPNRLSAPLRVFAREGDVICTLSSAVKWVRDRQDLALFPDLKLSSAAFKWAMFADLVGVATTGITVRTAAARDVGGFCEALHRTEDREFLIRLAARGTARLLPEVLWEKSWVDDSLSNAWQTAGRDLMRYVEQRPEYVTQYRKLGSYLASKILVADLRQHALATMVQDWRRFRQAGLLGGVANTVRAHRQVRRYRRRMAGREDVAALTGPPADW